MSSGTFYHSPDTLAEPLIGPSSLDRPANYGTVGPSVERTFSTDPLVKRIPPIGHIGHIGPTARVGPAEEAVRSNNLEESGDSSATRISN
jgi:hypothetical protein